MHLFFKYGKHIILRKTLKKKIISAKNMYVLSFPSHLSLQLSLNWLIYCLNLERICESHLGDVHINTF